MQCSKGHVLVVEKMSLSKQELLEMMLQDFFINFFGMLKTVWILKKGGLKMPCYREAS